MNTLIYLWVEPLVMNHSRSTDKVYFNLIVPGNHSKLDTDGLDKILEGENMANIMDFADIESNWNYLAVSAKATSKPVSIEYAKSPEQEQEVKEEKKAAKEIMKIANSPKDFKIDKSNVEILDGGKIGISLPALRVNDSIDFDKLWATIEKDFIGKIQEGDEVTLVDDEGRPIFEIRGGSFLNIGVADLGVYDSKKLSQDSSMMGRNEAIKGGLFLRDNGVVEVGDKERTFYLKIHTGRLLKASFKLNQSLTQLINQKLLKPQS